MERVRRGSASVAFKAACIYRDAGGLLRKVVYCGFIMGKKYFSIQYVALVRHYFDKYLQTFDKIVQSFKLTRE
jgi:hypothetical protein